MIGARWTEIEPLLDRALALGPELRSAFVEESCSGDQELLAELEAYLELDARPDPIFEHPVIDLIAGRPPECRIGERVGPYRLDAEIARGGMGVVYAASRVEGGFEQRVAIKVLKRGFDSGDFVRRFRTEQQILANLDHSNIVRLLDGGTTADGLPYLVMEAVDGTRLDRYLEREAPSKRKRLELFLEICDAVHSAHWHLVVHCDLKPSNILITAEGEPKLLDFGISRVLESSDDPMTRSLALRLGSPPYCSPEQAAGEAVTMASDVFSLGGLLVFLLTGAPPEPHPGPDALPAPPSRAAEASIGASTAAPLPASELRGDLDAIALAALAWEPAERYASAAALADDVRRHLAGLPVSAQHATWRYLFGRLVSRRRRELAIAAMVLALLAVAAASALAMALEARDEARRAEGMRAAYLEMLEVIDATAAESEAEATRSAVDALLAASRPERPADQAMIYDRLGRMLYRLEAYPEAEETLERAVALRRELEPPAPRRLAESLNNLALVQRARGEHGRALELLDEALRLHGQEVSLRSLELVDMTVNLAGALRRAQPARAEALYRRAIAGYRRLEPAGSVDLAKALGGYGMLLYTHQRLAPAEEALREALELRTRLQGDDHLELATPLLNLATVLDARGEGDRAVELYHRAYALRLRRSGESRPDTARAAYALAHALEGRGAASDLAEAERLLESALPVLRDDPRAGPGGDLVLRAETRLAAVRLARGDAESAAGLLRGVLERAPATWTGPNAWRLAEARSLLGAALLAQGESTAARPLLEASAAELAETRGEDSRPAREARERWEAWLGAR